MKIDPRHLAQLSTIVEAGSFQLAADRLNLSQPALSRNIRTLEQRIGAPVFNRNRRRAVPTELGRRLARSGLAIRVAEEQATTYSTQAASGSAGELRIGVPPGLAGKFLTVPLAGFIRENPECNVDLRVGLIHELRAMLERGQIDLVIGPHILAEQVAELVCKHLVDDQLGILCRVGHPLTQKETVSPLDLEQLSWIAHPKGSILRQQIETALLNAGLNQIRTVYEMESTRAMIEVISETDLVAGMPLIATTPYLGDDLTFLKLDYVLMHRPMGVISRRDSMNSSVQKKFLKKLEFHIDNTLTLTAG